MVDLLKKVEGARCLLGPLFMWCYRSYRKVLSILIFRMLLLSETSHAAASVAAASAHVSSSSFHAFSLWCVAALSAFLCLFASLTAASIASAELAEAVAEVEHDVAVD